MTIEPLTPERRRQQTRDHLLRAAAQVFAEHGYHGASLDEVASVAGFTKGAVYSNFKNKEDLFLALLKSNYEHELEVLRSTLDASEIPPEFRLSDFVRFIQGQLREVPPNYGLLIQEFWLYAARNLSARERLIAIDDEATRAIAGILEAEQQRQGLKLDESAVQIALLIESLFRGISMLRLLQPQLVDEEFLEAAVSFISRGLGADTSGRPGAGI
jgi:AcrR family transcriptional regulator